MPVDRLATAEAIYFRCGVRTRGNLVTSSLVSSYQTLPVTKDTNAEPRNFGLSSRTAKVKCRIQAGDDGELIDASVAFYTIFVDNEAL